LYHVTQTRAFQLIVGVLSEVILSEFDVHKSLAVAKSSPVGAEARAKSFIVKV
jgi:hypothetical protein